MHWGIEYQTKANKEQENLADFLYQNGVDIRALQEILGHESIATTEIYTEVTAQRKKQVLDRFNYRNKL